MSSISVLTRRSALVLAAGAAVCATTGSQAAEEQIVTVYKDPTCGCCLVLEQDRSGEDRGGYEGCRFDAIQRSRAKLRGG